MRYMGLAGVVLVLAGCTSGIAMRNPATGQTAYCESYSKFGMVGAMNSTANEMHQQKCIDDFARQGYVRISN